MSIFEYAEYKDLNQCEQILHYMEKHGSITSIEASSVLSITRLASRIHDLTREGYVIERKTECSKNRYGKPVHYTRYTLGAVKDG